MLLNTITKHMNEHVAGLVLMLIGVVGTILAIYIFYKLDVGTGLGAEYTCLVPVMILCFSCVFVYSGYKMAMMNEKQILVKKAEQIMLENYRKMQDNIIRHKIETHKIEVERIVEQLQKQKLINNTG